MSANHYKKGSGFERSLVNQFWDNKWAAVRAAGSGSTSHCVPDVVAVYSGQAIAIECKTTGKDRLYVKKAVEGLGVFCQTAGCDGFIAVKFDRLKPRFYPLSHFRVTSDYTVRKTTPHVSFSMLLGHQRRL